jgi:hypothetical protein
MQLYLFRGWRIGSLDQGGIVQRTSCGIVAAATWRVGSLDQGGVHPELSRKVEEEGLAVVHGQRTTSQQCEIRRTASSRCLSAESFIVDTVESYGREATVAVYPLNLSL